jgi:branched-chain amino acid transport system ATP-binding protein
VTAPPLLSLKDVHAYYGEAHILQGISLDVGEGEVVTLIGRNGAGKTTTLRSIMGLVPPRGGSITFAGQELRDMPTHAIARAGIAYVPEERRILPNLTVAENLRLGRLGGKGARRNGDTVTEEVLGYFPRLRERLSQKGKSLSGGEQQMLAIARGLVASPRLMLVDEPTEGLSPLIVASLTDILREINRRGTAILLVEQILEVALALSHRLYVMDQGRIQFEGTADALRADPAVQQRFLGV